MDYWCYAIINNKLAELYYSLNHNKRVITGHAYLSPTDRWSLRDVTEMQKDVINNQYIYYRHSYHHVG